MVYNQNRLENYFVGLILIKLVLTALVLTIIISSFATAAPTEIFIHGVVRNATDNNLTSAVKDIFINLTNTSTGITVYNQTQGSQDINNGVYQTVFSGINSKWFLWPISFTIKVGSDTFTQKTLVPVPIAHAAYYANDSEFLGGYNSAAFVLVSSTTDWDKYAADDYNNINFTAHLASSDVRNSIEHNITMVNTSMKLYVDSNGGTKDSTLINETEMDNVTLIRQSNTSWVTSMIDNASVLRVFNTSWLFNNMDNLSIIRNSNTSWVTNRLDNGSLIRANNLSWVRQAINLTGYLSNLTNITGTLTDGKICVYDDYQKKINCTYTDQTGGAGGGGIWVDGGEYIYINETIAYRFNTTVNYSQLLKCGFGEHLEVLSGKVLNIQTTDENDYNMKKNWTSNGYLNSDSEHLSFGVEDIRPEGQGFIVYRGVQNFNISALIGKDIIKATLRIAVSTYQDASKQLALKVYANYANSYFTRTQCNANKELCWNISDLSSTAITEWGDMMFYPDNIGVAGVGNVGISPPQTYRDITNTLKDALGNTTLTIYYRAQWDDGTNITDKVPPLGDFMSSGYPSALVELLSYSASGGIELAGYGYDQAPHTELIVWYNDTAGEQYQCVKDQEGHQFGWISSMPDVSKTTLTRMMNRSDIYINCSNIFFENGIGSSGICDGADATGSGAADSTLINESELDNQTILRLWNTTWLFENMANITIVRTNNVSWVTSMLDNATVIRPQNISWVNSTGHTMFLPKDGGNYTLTKGYNFTSSYANNLLKLDANGDCGASSSVGGCINVDMTDSDGAGLVLYSANDATSSGHLFVSRVNNVAFDQNAIYATSIGNQHTATILYAANNSGKSALNVASSNTNYSAMLVSGYETTTGSLKVTHNNIADLDDTNAAVLSLNINTYGTKARGLWIYSDGNTTGDLISAGNYGNRLFTVNNTGAVSILKQYPHFALDVDGEINATNIYSNNAQVCTYAGFNAENITGGSLQVARIPGFYTMVNYTENALRNGNINATNTSWLYTSISNGTIIRNLNTTWAGLAVSNGTILRNTSDAVMKSLNLTQELSMNHRNITSVQCIIFESGGDICTG